MKCQECGHIILNDHQAINAAWRTGQGVAYGHWHDPYMPSYPTRYRVKNGLLEYWFDAPWQIGGSYKWQTY